MPEWSKGVDLRPTVIKRVGSNPTGCNNNIHSNIIELIANIMLS